MENWRKLLEFEKKAYRPGLASSPIGQYESPFADSQDEGDILAKLAEILENWKGPDYESMSDDARWQAYAQDVQELINQYEGAESKEKKAPPKSKSAKGASGSKPNASKSMGKWTY